MNKKLDELIEPGRDVAEHAVKKAVEPVKSVASGAARGLDRFRQIEASGGIALILAAIVSMIAANSQWSTAIAALLHTHLRIEFGQTGIDRSLLHWVNDGLMAIFFFLAGLELKRELLTGHMRSLPVLVLPLAAAVGGIVCPALIYLALNISEPANLRGWRSRQQPT